MMSTARPLWIAFLSAVLAVASSFARAALAEPSVAEDPQRLVAETIDELIDRLKENSEAIHQDSSIAYRISDELVAPHIDFPRVTRLVIGKYWRSASDQQRQHHSRAQVMSSFLHFHSPARRQGIRGPFTAPPS